MSDLSPVQLFGLDQGGKSATVTAQRHLNLFAEIKQEAEKSRVVFYGTPGTSLFSSANGDTPTRGWIAVGNLLYYVHRGTFYQIDNAGTRTSRGTLSTTTGRVDLSYDGAVILIVDGTTGYTYTIATTTFIEIADIDFPDGANTCDWLDGQFIVDDGTGSDAFFISADGTVWDALDFATAESAPDGLVRVFVDHGQVLLFGEKTIEPWGNIGTGDFPFSPVKGSTAQFGLASRWSLTKFNDTVAFLGKNEGGQVQVMILEQYAPKPISSQELDDLINKYSSVSDATFYSYMLGGHPMLQCNFPTAGKSWLYDASTGLWSPLEYGLDGGRHRGEMHVDFLGRALIADYSNGNIYELDPDVYTDNGTAIARELIGRHIFRGNERITVDEIYVDMEVGVGTATGQGVNPQAMLSVSKSNGKTWNNPRWAKIGKVGEYLARVAWRKFGECRDLTVKLRLTDPVKVVIAFAAMSIR